MNNEDQLIILKETFQKEGSDEEVVGLTLMIDGGMKFIFDKIKSDRVYESDEEVLRDIIFEGVNSIVNGSNNG